MANTIPSAPAEPAEARAPALIPAEVDDPAYELHCAISRKRTREDEEQEDGPANANAAAAVAAAAAQARAQQLYIQYSVAGLKEMVGALEADIDDVEEEEEDSDGSDSELDPDSSDPDSGEDLDEEEEDDEEEDLEALHAMLVQATQCANATTAMMNGWKRRKAVMAGV